MHRNPRKPRQATGSKGRQAPDKLEVRHLTLKRGESGEAELRAAIEALGYRCTRYAYPAGTVFPEHTHPVDKIDAVLTGCLRLTTPHQQLDLGPGDFVRIPAGMVHRAEVIGSETVISLDGVRKPQSE